MQLTIYSFLMAVISSTFMIIAIYFLRKTRYFNDAFGIVFMLLMYILSLIRMLVPLEIPSIQIVIDDKVFLTHIMDFLLNRSKFTENLYWPLLNILVFISFAVTGTLLFVFISKQVKFTKKIAGAYNYATDKECELLSTVVSKTLKKNLKIKLVKTDIVNTPMSIGLIYPVIIIPNREYEDNELEMIFVHECIHFKNNDLWLKLLVHIYCCFCWWNPFVYLLEADMSFILEIKCDNVACRNFSESERLDYAQAINVCAKNAHKNKLPAVLVASGFASNKGTKRYVYRMNNLLSNKHRTTKNFVPVVIVSVMMVLSYAVSFLYVWQPSYEHVHSYEVLEHEQGAANSEDVYNNYSSFLVKLEDGSYIFHHDNEDILVSKKEYDAGVYSGYPVFLESGRKISN